MEQKFFICETCGNIVAMVRPSGVPVVCCGKIMKELVPGTTDASVEKHVPVYKVENGRVEVVIGEVIHPMTEEHLIEWVAIETEKGYQVQYLKANEAPMCEFKLADGDALVGVYAYCNLHGLWKA